MASKKPRPQSLGLFYLVHFGGKDLRSPHFSSPSKQNCKGNGKQFHKNRYVLLAMHSAARLKATAATSALDTTHLSSASGVSAYLVTCLLNTRSRISE
ncbi:hypothetical protein FHG87_024260, partial [Trinorchestia longiramus]